MLARQQDGAGHTYLKVLPPLILLSADVQLDSPPRSQSRQNKPCHDFLYISGAFRRLYPVGRSVGLLG